MIGNTRNSLITEFQRWKTESFIPKNVHSALKWNDKDTFKLSPMVEGGEWRIVRSQSQKEKEENRNRERNEEYIEDLSQGKSLCLGLIRRKGKTSGVEVIRT